MSGENYGCHLHPDPTANILWGVGGSDRADVPYSARLYKYMKVYAEREQRYPTSELLDSDRYL